MDEIYESNAMQHKPWKKVLCVFLSIILAFGTLVTLTVGSSRLQDWLGIKSMLSAYAEEFVDTNGAVAVDEESMLADRNVIDLENRDGSNTVYVFSEPITFTDENGNLRAKDISVERQSDNELKSDGYEYTNGQNDYRINFSKDIGKGIFVEFDNCGYSIVPNTVFQSSSGSKTVSELLNEEFETFEYTGAYGAGTTLRFYPQLNGVKDEIVLNQNIGRNSFSFTLETDNCTAALNDDGTVTLVNSDNETVQVFSAPFAYDSEFVEGIYDSHYTDCEYTLEQLDVNTYTLMVTVDNDWLNSSDTVYPVVIDPTTSNVSDSADAGVYSKCASNNYGNEQTGCFGKDTGYGYGRVYEKFTVPSAIKAGASISYAYHWVRETTGATSSTYARPFMVTSSWSETGITWSNKPGYDTTVNTNWKNINSNSTDNADNPYWYNYNLVNCVKKWINGTANYGVVYVSGEEVDADQEYKWRAWASRTYSASAMRPYTVINYTNDATAPTVTSVTGNPTSWTNGNVTLTVNGAADNSGGAGLHSTPYSFSTTKGSYSWQSGNTKTFSSNCTVYVYVRDALGNIRLASTQTICKIDKTKPTAPTITGNAENWTIDPVTLTAASSDDASGIKDYSFSTVAGTYSWQTSNTKTFDSNTTVYVYARDNAGNISSATQICIDKIDNAKPSIPIVTGNTDDWTNGDIELTAQSIDDLSGVSAYSFSTTEGVFSWQSENIYSATEQGILYIYSKDNVGNVSEPKVIDLKIDKLFPTGAVSGNEGENWVEEVVLTANADDELSGLAEDAYSFSSAEGEYNWQASNTKTITSNGTYYIYARDIAGNITLLDTVVIDKIDRNYPNTRNIEVTDNGNKTVITITATDDVSGVAQYSIDNGKTWQTSNIFEIEKDSLNYIAVTTKDNSGKIQRFTEYYDFYVPEIYCIDGYICAFNANEKCQNSEQNEIYYTFSGTMTDDSKLYTSPISYDNQNFIYVSFHPLPLNRTWTQYYKTVNQTSKANMFSIYEEDVFNLQLKYKTLCFDLNGKIKDDIFNLSAESCMDLPNENIFHTILPNLKEVFFIKENKYLYNDPINGYQMSVVYDENDENIVSVSIKADKIIYEYSITIYDWFLELTGVSDKYGNRFDITTSSTDETYDVLITDETNRECLIRYYDYYAEIIDFNGGVIRCNFTEGGFVTQVTDQANKIIGSYEYNNNYRVSKSGNMSIEYDSNGRISKYLYDSGAYTSFEYGNKSVTITTSDEKTYSYTYLSNGQIASYTDEYGDVTEYEYDGINLLSVEKGDSVCSYTYDEHGNMLSATSADSKTENYYYDDEDRLITKITAEECIHYTYDDNGNITMTAKVQDDYKTDYNKLAYDENFEYYDIVRYYYDNGMLVRVENSAENSTTVYTYDAVGNAVKVTTTVTDGDKTTVTVSDYTYDNCGRILSTISDESEIYYTYDAAGRTILTNADGNYLRTVYDNYGRVIQEITDTYYDPELDSLTDGYGDTTAGHTYEYNANGSLIRETNENGLSTSYEYSDVGTLCKKSFDIYDYYYNVDGSIDKVDVSGNTVVDYDYKTIDTVLELESGQYVNKITYSNGYVEEQKYNADDSLFAKYANGEAYYMISTGLLAESSTYLENEIDRKTTVKYENDVFTYEKQTWRFQNVFSYTASKNDGTQTINETHQNKNYSTVIGENSVSYTAPNSSFEYIISSENDTATQKIRSNSEDIITSGITYDETENILTKSYSTDNLVYSVEYDDSGNIVSDGIKSYTYNSFGELVSATGHVNSSYTYDGRGNMLSKTADGVETSYRYDNPDWLDQLTAVNDDELSYDENGNLISYNGKDYSWCHGKWLNTVTDDENQYSYSYDSTGIRSSKTVNGETTNFDTLGGQILAQYDSSNNIYFQYNNETPIGFVLNGIQYFYLTNPSGDVVGITDAEGNLIATYSYDEWGKLLDIETAEEDNILQLYIAEINPLRYRGYYYDNETGMYYLQSRYYDPELCRFISADDFNHLDTSTKFSINAYIYCWNCPVAFDDSEGTTPELSINLADIISFIQNIYNRVKDDITAGIDKLTNKLNNLVDKWMNSFKTHYNSLIDKLEYFINYPDAVINDTLSKTFNKDVNIRFRFIEFIREKMNLSISLSKLKFDDEQIFNENKLKISLYSNDESKPYVSETGKLIAVVITEIFTCLDLQAIAKKLGKIFSFDNLEDYRQKKVDLYKEAFDKGIIKFWTSENESESSTAGWISTIASLFDELLPRNASTGIALLPYITNTIDDTSGRYISPIGTFIMLLFDGLTNGIIDISSAVISSVATPIVGTLVSLLFNDLLDRLGTRDKAEYIAYNWYYLLFI